MRKQNGTIWVDGEQADWETARIPLMSDALLRGLSVFDGLIARRQADGGLSLVAADRHLYRLRRSCEVMGLPLEAKHEDLLQACVSATAAEAEGHPECDVYVRPMVVGAVLTSRAEAASVTVAAFRRDPLPPEPVAMSTSSWRRPSGDSMPADVKAVGNYQLTRLARMEAHRAGCDDALLLNSAGRIAEAAGSAILVETDDRVLSPPVHEDCLDSITVRMLEALALREGVSLVREPVSRVTGLGAVGLALAGTLSDVVPVGRLDHREYDVDAPLLSRLRSHYLTASRGGDGADLLEGVEVR